MSLSNLTNRATYTGAAATAYAYTFHIFDATNLLVTKRAASGTETTLAYPTDYTVSGVGDAAGGTVTLSTATATTDTLVIRRVLPLTQPTGFRSQGAFLPASHEDALDRLTMIAQQQQDTLARTITLPESIDPAVVSPTLPVPTASAVLAWNGLGTALENVTATAGLALSGFIEIDVAAFAGATLSAKLIAALASVLTGGLLPGGVILNAKRFSGTQVLAADIFAALSVVDTNAVIVELGPYELRVSATQALCTRHVWRLNGTQIVMKTPGGARVTATGLWQGRTTSGLFAVTSGNATITSNAGTLLPGITKGTCLGVFGHIPTGGSDRGTITGAHTSGQLTLTIDATLYAALASSGWLRTSTGEIIYYTAKAGANTLTVATRGYGGTTATAYVGAEQIDRAVYQIFEVTATSGATVTLDSAPTVTATAIDVFWGAAHASVTGVGSIDGNMDPAVDDTANPYGIYTLFGSYIQAGRELEWFGWDHGAINLEASMRSSIDGTFRDMTRPSLSLGSAVWLFGGARNNVIRGKMIRVHEGVHIDDRTTGPALRDNSCDYNTVDVDVDTCNYGVVISCGVYGTYRCRVKDYAVNAFTGEAQQWVKNLGSGGMPFASYNVVAVEAHKPASGGLVTLLANSAWLQNSFTCTQPEVSVISVPAFNTLRGPDGTWPLTPSGTTVTPLVSRGQHFPVTLVSTSSHTFANPSTTPYTGWMLDLLITNGAGGAIANPTWGAMYQTAGTFTMPASTAKKRIVFQYDATLGKLVEQYRSPADIT